MRIMAKVLGFCGWVLGRIAELFVASEPETTMLVGPLGEPIGLMSMVDDILGVRLLAGLTVFGLTCHLMAEHIANYLGRLPEDVLRVAKLLGSA